MVDTIHVYIETVKPYSFKDIYWKDVLSVVLDNKSNARLCAHGDKNRWDGFGKGHVNTNKKYINLRQEYNCFCITLFIGCKYKCMSTLKLHFSLLLRWMWYNKTLFSALEIRYFSLCLPFIFYSRLLMVGLKIGLTFAGILNDSYRE